ncbi:MAG: GNAT family N-acetyltransferase [Tannerellaceae bacterium]|nr:GNAT family N-acetyltransferase [Tannerellaceae bacterium]
MEIIRIRDMDVLTNLRFAFLSEMSSVPEEEWVSVKSQLRSYFERHIRRDDFVALGVSLAGEIVSCAFLIVDERPGSLSSPNGLTGTILNVFTYPQYQRKGFGLAVMEAIIEESKERNLSVLSLSSTEAGKRLYEKLGFKESDYTEMKLKISKWGMDWR